MLSNYCHWLIARRDLLIPRLTFSPTVLACQIARSSTSDSLVSVQVRHTECKEESKPLSILICAKHGDRHFRHSNTYLQPSSQSSECHEYYALICMRPKMTKFRSKSNYSQHPGAGIWWVWHLISSTTVIGAGGLYTHINLRSAPDHKKWNAIRGR